MRIELFFKTIPQLRARVQEISGQGFTKFSLVNKNKTDELLRWVEIIHDEVPTADVCVHYSLKYNKQGREGPTEAFDRFRHTLSALSKLCVAPKQGKHQHPARVLLISGSGNKRPLDSGECLQRLAKNRTQRGAQDLATSVDIGVAFNPYFEKDSDIETERKRLQRKLASGCVSSVWLQFGSDSKRLADSLMWFRSLEISRGVRLVGSLFLPTKQLIAQQKFRPWNGVFLSLAYLSGPAQATTLTLELLEVYHQFDVEPLVEAPGIRSLKDIAILRSLLAQARPTQKDDDAAASDELKQAVAKTIDSSLTRRGSEGNFGEGGRGGRGGISILYTHDYKHRRKKPKRSRHGPCNSAAFIWF